MKPSQLLKRAQKVLRKRGWVQGTLSDHGRVCAYGALNEALYGISTPSNSTKTKENERLIKDTVMYVSSLIRDEGYNLVPVASSADNLSTKQLTRWNDYTAQNQDEVEAIFEIASSKLESEGR